MEKIIKHLTTTLQWIEDQEKGEMIEAKHTDGSRYCKSYLSFANTISQEELNAICKIVNKVMILKHSIWRVNNYMGEIIPNKRRNNVTM